MNYQEIAEQLMSRPIRKCYSLHECCLCKMPIRLGDFYCGDKPRRRAHLVCISDTLRRSDTKGTK